MKPRILGYTAAQWILIMRHGGWPADPMEAMKAWEANNEDKPRGQKIANVTYRELDWVAGFFVAVNRELDKS